MNEYFAGPGFNKNFTFKDEGIEVSGKIIKYETISDLRMITAPGLMTPGILQCTEVGNKPITLAYAFKDRERMAQVITRAKEMIDSTHGVEQKYLYKLQAHTGTSLEVYDDYIVISFMETGAYFANALKGGGNGGKKVDIESITSIQFKEPGGGTVGFIQFEYPGSIGNKAGLTAAINDENSIPVSPQNLELARTIVSFIEQRRKELKNATTGTTRMALSSADEILKYKNLLDAGVITQEEFDAKKKQLLGL